MQNYDFKNTTRLEVQLRRETLKNLQIEALRKGVAKQERQQIWLQQVRYMPVHKLTK